MALPLIIKAAALGGAAYVASRWLSTQSRQRRARSDMTSSPVLPTGDADNQPSSPYVGRDNYPEAGSKSIASANPTS